MPGFSDCHGQAPVGVPGLRKSTCESVRFCRGVTKDAGECNAAGIDAFFPIVRGVTTLDEAMVPKNAKENMILAVEQVFRVINLYTGSFSRFLDLDIEQVLMV